MPYLSWWLPHPSPSSSFVIFWLVLLVGWSRSVGPKVRVLLSCPHRPPGRALPIVGLCSSTVERPHIPLDCSQAPETQIPQDVVWEGKARCSAELTASRALPTHRYHPTADDRLLSSVSNFSHKHHSGGPRVFTLGTPACAFPIPFPEPQIQPPCRLFQKPCFLSSVGWLGFCYPWSWQSMSNLGHFGYLPFEGLDWGLKVQPVLLKTATSLVLSKASSDLPHPCPCPHHHCGPVLCYPDGRPIK